MPDPPFDLYSISGDANFQRTLLEYIIGSRRVIEAGIEAINRNGQNNYGHYRHQFGREIIRTYKQHSQLS